jgi:hypothetical protein
MDGSPYALGVSNPEPLLLHFPLLDLKGLSLLSVVVKFLFFQFFKTGLWVHGA